MPSGNIQTVAEVITRIISGIDKITLETELQTSGWTSTVAIGGSKSGQGTIWTNPQNNCSVRIMTQPNGLSYARVYNGPGEGAPGEQALNSQGKPGNRGDTHFLLSPN